MAIPQIWWDKFKAAQQAFLNAQKQQQASTAATQSGSTSTPTVTGTPKVTQTPKAQLSQINVQDLIWPSAITTLSNLREKVWVSQPKTADLFWTQNETIQK